MTKTSSLENVIEVKHTMSFARAVQSFTYQKGIVGTVSAVIQPSLTSEAPLGIHSLRQEPNPQAHDILLHVGTDQRRSDQAGSSDTASVSEANPMVTNKEMSPLQRLYKRVIQSLERDALENPDYEDTQEDGRDGFNSRFGRRDHEYGVPPRRFGGWQ